MEEQYIEINEKGYKNYFKDKKKTILHREDGPAVEHADGYRAWWLNDKLHRLDGPAVEYSSGGKGWFVNDVFIFGVDSSGQLIERME